MTDATPQSPQQVRGGRTVLGDYLSVLGARGAGVAIALASVILTTQLLGTEGYGRLNYLLVVPFLVVSLGSAWSSAAVLTIGREEFELHRELGRTTWARAVAIAPVILVAGAAVIIARAAFGAYAEYSWTLVLMAIGLAVLLVASDHVTYLMQAAGQMKLSAVTQTVQRGVTVAGIGALLVFAPDSGLTVFLLVSVGTTAAAAVYLFAKVGRRGFRPFAVDRVYVRRLLAFSIPLVATTLGAFGIRWCDILVIKLYGTFDDVGRYALAYQGYEVLLALTVAAVSVFTPLIVSLRLAERMDVVRRYYSRVVPLALALSGVLLGIAAAPAHALVPVVFGQAFADAADPLVILFVSLQFASAMSLLAVVLLGLDRTRSIALVTIGGVLVNVALDFALVPGVGIAGAAIATGTANVVMAVWMSWSTAGALGRPRARVLTASLPLAAGLAPVLIRPGIAGYLLGPVAAVLALIVVARLTSLVEREDAELLEQLRVPGPAARALGRAAELAGGRPR